MPEERPRRAEPEGIDDLIVEYLEAQDAGSAPAPEEFIASHPECADALRRYFAAEAELLPPVGPARGELPAIPGYEVLEEIARGGMGVVYRARDLALGRVVALKMLLGGPLAGRESLERFRREAHAIASLDHPGIVPIFEIGEAEGIPYYTMKLVEGGTLRERGGELRGDSRRIAELFEALARAVHFAHERGILHRDLKPANVLLDRDGTPLVSDFGLAKREESGPSLTLSSALLGTPQYMAPEQIRRDGRPLDVRTDVYGLGTILYELLTGRPPVEGDSSLDVLRRVADQEPVAPRRIDPSIPRDLETICRRCLEKEPARRYPNARALARELERFLDGRPIEARPLPPHERALRWCRRNPAAVIVVAALVITAAVAIGAAIQVSGQLERTQRAEEDGRRQLRGSLLAGARATRLGERAGRRTDALAAIARAAAIAPDLELRNEAIAALSLPDLVIEPLPAALAGARKPVAFDDGYRSCARTGPEGEVVVSAVDAPGAISTLRVNGRPMHYFFSPGGRFLAVQTADASGQLRCTVLDPASGVILREFSAPSMPGAVAFDPGRPRIAVGERSGAVEIAAIDDPADSIRLAGVSGPLMLRFSHDGVRLAVAHADRPTFQVWDAASGALLSTSMCDSPIHSLEWTGDSREILVGLRDGTIERRIPDDPDGVRVLAPHALAVHALSVSPDGGTLVSASYDSTIALHDLRLWRTILATPTEPETHFGFARRGDEAILGAFGVTEQRLTVLSPSPVLRVLPAPPAPHACLDLHPELPLLLVVTEVSIELWDIASARRLAHIPARGGYWGRFEPAGDSFITTSDLGGYRWSLRFDRSGAGSTPGSSIGPPRPIPALARTSGRFELDREGRILALARSDLPCVRVIDLEHPERPIREIPDTGVYSVAISADARFVATGNWNGRDAEVWDLSAEELSGHALVTGRENMGVHFSGDGEWLAVSASTAFHFFETGSFLPRLRVEREIAGDIPGLVAFRSDGASVFLQVSRATVDWVDLATGETLGRFESPDGRPIRAIACGRRHLAIATEGVAIWDLGRTARELERIGLGFREGFVDPVETPVPPLPTAAAELSLGDFGRAEEWPLDVPEETLAAELRSLDEEIARDPEAIGPRLRRARVLARAERFLESIREFDQVIRRVPERLDLLEGRASLSVRTEGWLEVIEDYGRILAANPGNAAARFWRAMGYREAGRSAEALADLELLDAEGHAHAEVPHQIAWILLHGSEEVRDPERAYREATRAVERSAAEARFRGTRGRAALRIGRVDEARADLERAVGLDPEGGSPLDLFFLAMACRAVGDEAGYRRAFERGLHAVESRRIPIGELEETRAALDEARSMPAP